MPDARARGAGRRDPAPTTAVYRGATRAGLRGRPGEAHTADGGAVPLPARPGEIAAVRVHGAA
ncbi:hypothetical protein Acsp04_22620 [Actinomadura sp. NBRC 104425]|nr:hypothetical protein Acsp04_22620 [Actinomadura sp. NBRC 104425]